MPSRHTFRLFFGFVLCFALFACGQAFARQDHYRGRKYKAPPPTSRIEVTVTKKSNGKPIPNAGVVFNPTRDGKDLGNLEVKTDPEGRAVVDIIPTGSTVLVQVIANGFSTFGQTYEVDQPTKEISIQMLRPQEQISAYEDNRGRASERKPGVQEPIRPKPAQPATTAPQF